MNSDPQIRKGLPFTPYEGVIGLFAFIGVGLGAYGYANAATLPTRTVPIGNIGASGLPTTPSQGQALERKMQGICNAAKARDALWITVRSRPLSTFGRVGLLPTTSQWARYYVDRLASIGCEVKAYAEQSMTKPAQRDPSFKAAAQNITGILGYSLPGALIAYNDRQLPATAQAQFRTALGKHADIDFAAVVNAAQPQTQP